MSFDNLRAHLKAAGQLQRVQQRNEDEGGDDDGEEDADDVDHVLRALRVHLSRGAQDQNGGHEGDQNGDGHGDDAHAAVGHQELLRRLLFASPAAVEDADGGGDDQHEDEQDIVDGAEETFFIFHGAGDDDFTAATIHQKENDGENMADRDALWGRNLIFIAYVYLNVRHKESLFVIFVDNCLFLNVGV